MCTERHSLILVKLVELVELELVELVRLAKLVEPLELTTVYPGGVERMSNTNMEILPKHRFSFPNFTQNCVYNAALVFP